MPEIDINTGKAVEELAKLEKALGSTIEKSGKFAGALQKGFVDPLIKATSNLATLTNVLNSSTASFSTFATTIQKTFKDLNKISQAKGASGKNAFGTLKDIIKSLNESSRGISTGSFPKAAVHLSQLANGLTKLAQADMKAVLSNIEELPKFLLLFETMKSSGVDKIGSGMNALMRAMRGISKVDMAAFRKNIVYISIDVRKFVNMMGIVTKSPNFIAFERLADAMFKVALASKSLVTATKKVNSAMKQMNGTTKESKGIFGKLTPTIKQFFTAFVGYNVIHAVTRSIKGAVAIFAEFELGMARVNTIARVSRQTLNKWGVQVKNLSSSLGLSKEELTKALYDINSATIVGSDSLYVLEAASKAAVAGFTSVDKTAELLSRIINAYGYAAADAGHLSDILFKTVERGINPMEELAQYMGRVLTVASNAGVSFEEVAAAIATMTSQGIQTNIAVTSLNSAILKLSQGNKQLNALFRKHGYATTSAALRYGGLTNTLRILNEETHGYTDALTKLKFNYRGIRAVSVLASTAFVEFENNLRLMTDAMEVQGATERALEEVLDTLTKKWGTLIEEIKNAGISFSEFLDNLGVFDRIIMSVKTFTRAVKALGAAFKELKSYIPEFLTKTPLLPFDLYGWFNYYSSVSKEAFPSTALISKVEEETHNTPAVTHGGTKSVVIPDFALDALESLKKAVSISEQDLINIELSGGGVDNYIKSLRASYKKLSEVRDKALQKGKWSTAAQKSYDSIKSMIDGLSGLRKELGGVLATLDYLTKSQVEYNKSVNALKKGATFSELLNDLYANRERGFISHTLIKSGFDAVISGIANGYPGFTNSAEIGAATDAFITIQNNMKKLYEAMDTITNTPESRVKRAQEFMSTLSNTQIEMFKKMSTMSGMPLDKILKVMQDFMDISIVRNPVECGKIFDQYLEYVEAQTTLRGVKTDTSKRGFTIKPSPSVAAASAAEVGTKEAVDLVSRQVFKDTYDETKKMKTIQELILKQLKHITDDVTRFILVD